MNSVWLQSYHSVQIIQNLSDNNLWRSDPALRFNHKYLNLCPEDERKSYGVKQHEGESHYWLSLHVCVNYPFNTASVSVNKTLKLKVCVRHCICVSGLKCVCLNCCDWPTRFCSHRPLNCWNFWDMRSWALPTALRTFPKTTERERETLDFKITLFTKKIKDTIFLVAAWRKAMDL